MKNAISTMFCCVFATVLLSCNGEIVKVQAPTPSNPIYTYDNYGYLTFAMDSSGNMYSAGFIKGDNTFDFGNNVSLIGLQNDYHLVVAKYNASGQAYWAKSVIEGTSKSMIYCIAVDGNSNIYAVGEMCGIGTETFDNGISVTSKFTGISPIIIKFDSAGQVIWAKTVDETSVSAEFFLVSVNKESVSAAGNIHGIGTIDFGNGIKKTGKTSGDTGFSISFDPLTGQSK